MPETIEEKCLLLFSSELQLIINNICRMSKLIVDAATDKIFFMVIHNDINHNITHENTKKNFEKMMVLIQNFLVSKNLELNDISGLYVNRGPGSFAGIRNSLSIVKALHLINKIDYYCFSFRDFSSDNEFKYENVPQLCEKFNLKKNLINPIYLS